VNDRALFQGCHDLTGRAAFQSGIKQNHPRLSGHTRKAKDRKEHGHGRPQHDGFLPQIQ
jgi:hypothetical protein